MAQQPTSAQSLLSIKVETPPDEDLSPSELQEPFPQAMEAGDLSRRFIQPKLGNKALRVSDSIELLMLDFQAADSSVAKSESTVMTAVQAKLGLDYAPSTWFLAHVTTQFQAEAGYAESRFGNYVPDNSFRLYDAYLQAHAEDWARLRVGAINQSSIEGNEILLGDATFPAAHEMLGYGGNLLRAEFQAEQAVPTATSLSTNTVQAEPMPSFLLEQIALVSKPVAWWQGKIYLTAFQFNDLPSIVAQNSVERGNTVTTNTPGLSQFKYEFAGLIWGVGNRIQLFSQTDFVLGASWLQNNQAPQNYGQGQAVFAGFEIKAPHEIVLKPRADMFLIDSDAGPSYWMESFYGGESNRTGWVASVKSEFKREKFAMGIAYLHSDPINLNPGQTSEDLVYLNFETHHVLF